MLSSKMMSAHASAACSTCSNVSASTSIFSFGNFSRARRDGGGDGIRLFTAQRGEVIVLDEHHIDQAEAMVVSAAAHDSVFFEAPPAGRGFARVQDLRVGSFDGLDKLRGQRGNAGKPLDEIQRNALGAQQGAGRAVHFQQGFILTGALAVFHHAARF